MNNPADDMRSRRHNLSDWLALHELDPVTCRRLLDIMAGETAGEPAAHDRSTVGYEAPDAEVAWLRTAEAMRRFFIEQQSIIDDTFEKSVKILVDHDKSRKALTLDNGTAAYPTIIFSYRGKPTDSLVIAHEFAHALQIRASRGKFVPPITREVCAFLGEHALLSHTLLCNAAQHRYLVQAWRRDNGKYLVERRNQLQADLLDPAALYKYYWNYPIARYLANQISERCSRDWIWSVFEGGASLREILKALDFSSSH